MEIIGNRELTYLYAAGTPFAIHEKNGEDENIYFLHLDYQGSIRAITNEQGAIVEERDYDACSMGFRFLQATSAVKILAPSIPKERSEIREGRPRDPYTLEYTATNPFSVSTITNRGYTFHVRETWFLHKNHSRTIPLSGKHIFEFSLINMNARMYDPVTRRVISPDNYIQAPDNTQSFNRYSYCWNNPLKYTDPDGNVVIAAVVIGAVVGAYVGGRIANEGIANPLEWNYDAQTWGYMAAGAVVGGASGGIASKIAVSGAAGAKTGAIAYGSYYNSVGTHIYTGGQTDVSVSFGFGSYNMSTGEAKGIWDWGDLSTGEKIGYSLGVLGNFSDVLTGFNSENIGSVEVGTKKGWPGHTQAKKGDDVLIDYGPNQSKGGIKPLDGVNDYMAHSSKGATKFIPNDKLAGGSYLTVKNLNYKTFSNYSSNIKSGKYLIPFNDCVVKVSRALNYSGVFNIGIHPKLLYYQLLLRSHGVNSYNYSHYLQFSE